MDTLNILFDKYHLSIKEKRIICKIIKDIYIHNEFQRRLTNEYMHHGNTSLGEHILEDTIITYIIIKRKNIKSINLEYALKIAMMHDLYTLSWQNNSKKTNSFFNKHGFVHPIEAAINSMVWLKNEFEEEAKAKVLIDGIVHHMYPFPVSVINSFKENYLELNNYDLIDDISKRNLKILKISTNRNSIKKISISKSLYIEGNIVSMADKISSIKQLETLGDFTALITGKNKRIIKKL